MKDIFKTIVDAVKEKGVLPVLNATFIFIVIGFIGSHLILEQKRAEAEQDILPLLIQQAVKEAHDNANEEHSKRFETRNKRAPEINRLIEGARTSFGADNIIIFEYHNGYTNINTGVPFGKFSATYESFGENAHPRSLDFQNCNISSVPVVNSLQDHAYIEMSIEELHKHDRMLHYYLSDIGVKTVVIAEIAQLGKQVGFVSILFKDSSKRPNPGSVIKLTNNLSGLLIIE